MSLPRPAVPAPTVADPALTVADPALGRGPARRAYRDSQTPILGGVAGGLAQHLGWPTLWVRVGFVVCTAFGGMGVALYAALWMVLPSDSRFVHQSPGLESASRTGKRPGRAGRLSDVGSAIALGAILLGLVIAAESVLGNGAVFWPVALAAAGIALLWRQADEAQRERWLDSSGRMNPLRAIFGPGGWASYARVGAGGLLIVVALVAFSLRSESLVAATNVVIAGIIGIVGLALVIGPWIIRLAGDLTAERAERVRSQERADLAAHLHDSVLQTLALIQKNAHDSTTVTRLARSQERDLRSWLYVGESVDESTLASALRGIGAAVEDNHLVSVDVVTVGDCVFGETLRPIVHAAGEAVTNAAKHAGTGRIDVFAEITAQGVDIFVRDRGVGFDPDEIADDRYGVRHSILDRMVRHGGTAEIRTAPGEGTEVRLRLPRSDRNDHDDSGDRDDSEAEEASPR